MSAIVTYRAKGFKVGLYEKSVVFDGGSLFFAREATKEDAAAVFNVYRDGYQAGFEAAQRAMLKALGIPNELTIRGHTETGSDL